MTLIMLAVVCMVGSSAQVDMGAIEELERRYAATESADSSLFFLSRMLELTLFNDTEMAATYVERFHERAVEVEMPEEVARSYNFMGMLAWVEGRNEEAIAHYLKGAEMYKTLEDPFMRGMMNNNIATLYESIDTHKSIDYFNQAREQFVELDTLQWISAVDYNLGNQYQQIEEYRLAKESYERAVKGFRLVGDSAHLMLCYSTLGSLNKRLGKYAESLAFYQLGLSRIDDDTDLSTRSTLHTSIAALYLESGEWDKAAEYCRIGLEEARRLGSIKELRSALDVNYDYHKAIGEYGPALSYLEEAQVLRDSVGAAEKVKDVQELMTKYETAEKEELIALQALTLEQKENEKRLYFYLIGVLGILLVGGILFEINRQKINKRLAEKNIEVQTALEEKELLLKEIHHRVKNNLQVISSLLSIQSREITDEKALEAVNESRNRVRSMALIHQDLYSEDDLKGIAAKQYVEKLSTSLLQSYKVGTDRIELKKDVEDLSLDVDTIIPLGLILNELMTNALKYGFPEERRGEILVYLRRHEDILRLQVADDGVGMKSAGMARKESFGMKMIAAFAKKLDAELKVDSTHGTLIQLDIRNFRLSR